ncbi:MAG: anti-sigma F factor [Ruminococcaceae bacterium]|nr:anti-sigma F factor [Oscillospiraceae bacterium]
MEYINRLSCEFEARSSNEGLARTIVASLALSLDPTLDELDDLRTAVSEAVTNSIIHGYNQECCPENIVYMDCILYEDRISVTVRDKGCGIEDVNKAMQPLYTSAPEMERSGMGFTVMETFTDRLVVKSTPGEGTSVTMVKIFSKNRE